MASDYAYITVANLENFTALDYSVIDSTFDDTHIEMTISTAEEIVNSFLVEVPASATDSMEAATKLLSAWFMNMHMESRGHTSEIRNAATGLTFVQILDLAKGMLQADNALGVDTIPMSGANQYYSFSGYY